MTIQKQIKSVTTYNEYIEDLNLLKLNGKEFGNYGFYLFNELAVPRGPSIVSVYNFDEHIILNFVNKDFEKLYKKLENDSLKNFIPFDSIFNTNKFKIIRSFESPLMKYKKYLSNLYTNFLIFLNKTKINNFSDFMLNFRNYILYTDTIITFSSFIKSNRCSIYSSGLSLKYTELENSVIVKDSNFEYFNNMCNRFNFFLEKNDLSKIIYLLTDKVEYISDYSYIFDIDLSLFINCIYSIYEYYYDDFLFIKQPKEKFLSSKQVINLYVQTILRESNIVYSKSVLDKTLKEIYFMLGLKDVGYVTRMIRKLKNDPKELDLKMDQV